MDQHEPNHPTDAGEPRPRDEYEEGDRHPHPGAQDEHGGAATLTEDADEALASTEGEEDDADAAAEGAPGGIERRRSTRPPLPFGWTDTGQAGRPTTPDLQFVPGFL